MMRVTVEIVPGGNEAVKYTIRTYEIGNIGHLDHMNPTIRRYAVWRTDGLPRHEREPDFYVWHDRDDGPDVLVERVLARLRTGKEGPSGIPGVHPRSGRRRSGDWSGSLAEAAAA